MCACAQLSSLSTPGRHCTSSREGKVVLSCWITERLRQELDRVWAEQGLRPHGRTQKGMESMINSFLANHAAEER
jgi:hypothetical protein